MAQVGVWSVRIHTRGVAHCDVMAGALWTWLRYRTFNVFDDFNGEGLRIESQYQHAGCASSGP
jgi:hypothetical protein